VKPLHRNLLLAGIALTGTSMAVIVGGIMATALAFAALGRNGLSHPRTVAARLEPLVLVTWSGYLLGAIGILLVLVSVILLMLQRRSGDRPAVFPVHGDAAGAASSRPGTAP
jgi:hypothetical protein